MSKVLISILNWNKASKTLECVSSLKTMCLNGIDIHTVVIDNGSRTEEYSTLKVGLAPFAVELIRLEKNLGFTGGHNVSIKTAVGKDYDFIWLLNNDATVEVDTLQKLVDGIREDDRCGAVSPVFNGMDGTPEGCSYGMTHDWATRVTHWLPSAEASQGLHQTHPEHICLSGAAILLRVRAMRDIGLLDDRLFAYYDDNDLGARLGKAGWRSKVIFDARTFHPLRPNEEHPLYYYYLMHRNELTFWYTNVPKTYRKLLWLRMVNQSLYRVALQRRRGWTRQADIALLGIWDFICGRFGAPDLDRTLPAPARLLFKLWSTLHSKQVQSVVLVPTVPS